MFISVISITNVQYHYDDSVTKKNIYTNLNRINVVGSYFKGSSVSGRGQRRNERNLGNEKNSREDCGKKEAEGSRIKGKERTPSATAAHPRLPHQKIVPLNMLLSRVVQQLIICLFFMSCFIIWMERSKKITNIRKLVMPTFKC